MYKLRPPAVYAHESVVANPQYKARLDRVVSALAVPVEPVVYADAELPGLIEERRLLAGRVPMGGMGSIPDPILLFNTFRLDGRRRERQEWLRKQCPAIRDGHALAGLTGYEPWQYECYNQPGDPLRNDKVCRPCWRLHFQNGCAHKCHYCGFGGLLITMVNVEDYIAQLDRLIAAHPWQETFLLEDDADVLCLEPELDCLGPLIEHFGTLDRRYLVIHTKSPNVDWMLDLEHNGNTIIVWSLAAPTQAERLEPVTGTTAERIEAARKCQDAGYTVRYKFKPIVPVRNWRAEAAETLRLLFERTRPDVISLCAFMWLDVDELKRRLDTSLLDPEFLRAAEEARDQMADTNAKPFPHRMRAEIYEHHFHEIRKHDADVPVSLSTENFRMWRDLGPMLGATPTNYVCGCGPNSTPGRKKLLAHPFRTPQKSAAANFDEM